MCNIPADTELTFNYNLHCVGNRRTSCHCGSDNCSGFLGVQPTVRSFTNIYHDLLFLILILLLFLGSRHFEALFDAIFPSCLCQSAVVMEKEEKARNAKLKPKKRKLRLEGKHTHEYYCFCCGEGGELVMCDRRDCPKAYHLLCLNLTKPPYGNSNMSLSVCFH